MTVISLIAPLQWLVDISGAILNFFHDQVGFGWGASIVAMTVVIRLAILPLTFKSVKGMQELQRLQPELKKLQERYKGDRQRFAQEQARLFKEHEVNPAASCLPVLLQFPFFIALFYLLQRNEDIRGEPFLFIPDLGAEATGGVLVALLVIYVVTQLGASAVSAASATGQQRWIFLALPFVILPFIILYGFPAGLLVYWITTNVWTVGQQVLVRKLYPKPEPVTAGGEGARPAHGKPVAAAAVTDGRDGSTATDDGRKARGTGAATSGGNGRARKAPPPSPRKKKKRSGRRR